jgi:hypothetical protein
MESFTSAAGANFIFRSHLLAATRTQFFKRRAALGAESEVFLQRSHAFRAQTHLNLIGQNSYDHFRFRLAAVYKLDDVFQLIVLLVAEPDGDSAAEKEVSEISAGHEPSWISRKSDFVPKITAFDINKPQIRQKQVVHLFSPPHFSGFSLLFAVADRNEKIFGRRKRLPKFFELIIFYTNYRFHKKPDKSDSKMR